MRHPPIILALLLALAGLVRPAAAEPPRIVASILPLQGLAAMVADGVAEPVLLMPGNASPHTYSLRPSQARALAGADLVLWIGPGLETFLAGPLDSLAGGARRLTVADLPGLRRLPARRGGIWEDEDDEHRHAPAGGEKATPQPAGPHLDPHLWLDPGNAMVVLGAVAAALAEIDPDNADAYRDNARLGRQRLAALDAALAARLQPLTNRPFVVFHDAYQYLERRYGLSAVGALTVSPEIRPGARRLAALREEIERRGAVCIFAEPQFPPRAIEQIAGGTGAAVGVLDPLGAGIDPGRDAYLILMDRLGAAAVDCLAGPA
jgi:zinc transport system substrate-binding protein